MNKEPILAAINRGSKFNTHNGIKVVDFDKSFCAVEGELRPEALNPAGIAHGGFVYSLCDVAAGMAVGLTGRRAVTLSSNMYFLHSAKGAVLRAEGRVVKDGKSVVIVETSVYDDSGKMTARGSFEMFVLDKTEKAK